MYNRRVGVFMCHGDGGLVDYVCVFEILLRVWCDGRFLYGSLFGDFGGTVYFWAWNVRKKENSRLLKQDGRQRN